MTFATLAIAVLLLCWAAVNDFRSWKIPNWIVGSLCILYGLHVALTALIGLQPGVWSASTLMGDLGAFGLLLAIGYLFWRLKMFGAGDAKLLAAVGLFAGWGGLLSFSVVLFVGAVIAWLLLKLPMPRAMHTSLFLLRIDEIRQTRKIPYGVVIVPAALVVILQRYQLTL